MIKYRTEKVINVWDWDALVKETYGKKYCFQQQDDCRERGHFRFTVPSDEVYDEFMPETIPEVVNGKTMGVRFQTWLDRDPEYNVFKETYENNLFWDRNFYPDFQTLANDLHSKGLIEAGDYTIDIDW